jgi:hypothetical protein
MTAIVVGLYLYSPAFLVTSFFIRPLLTSTNGGKVNIEVFPAELSYSFVALFVENCMTDILCLLHLCTYFIFTAQIQFLIR